MFCNQTSFFSNITLKPNIILVCRQVCLIVACFVFGHFLFWKYRQWLGGVANVALHLTTAVKTWSHDTVICKVNSLSLYIHGGRKSGLKVIKKRKQQTKKWMYTKPMTWCESGYCLPSGHQNKTIVTSAPCALLNKCAALLVPSWASDCQQCR